ncbi:MAG TPA: bifunctional DNA primase/polymerase [Rhizobiaceae bacterium]|nr:bifunctional DNA primase/polymerase [Rhizobiaceae bacterium]
MTELMNLVQTIDAARAFVERGWEPIPLQPTGKNPKASWKTPVVWGDQQISAEFSSNDNIGVALGERSNGLVDIDFDWPEAARIADAVFADLPSFGRPGSLRSHRIVRCHLSKGRLLFQLPAKNADALLVDRTTVLEIRGDKHQTMFPPSIHPTGEVVRWDQEPDNVPELAADDLERRGGLCAALAVVLNVYPRVPGDRDNVCLALTGALVRVGLEDNEVDHLVALVAHLAGDDEASKRGGKAAATRAKIAADEPTWGLPELCERLGIGELEATLRKWLGGGAVSTETRTSRDILVLPGILPQIVDEAEKALIDGGAGVYQRGETLVRVVVLDANEQIAGVRRTGGTVMLREVKQAWLIEQLSLAASWSKSGTEHPVRIDPPAKVASTYLARVGSWRVPSLIGITQAPMLRSDGSILQTPGYDAASRMFYDPGGVIFPPIPNSPTREDAERALAQLQHPFRAFSFANEESSSVALAAVLTALVRPSLRAAPMFAIDAPTAGTGKSLLAETISIIATGHAPAMMSQGASAEEDQKRLASVLIAGDPVIVLDNCERPIGGDLLCSMLTQESVGTRILGKSEMISLPTTAVVIATGNNLLLAGDVSRRALICRLDARTERPDQLQYDFDPRDEARSERPVLVAAALTILRAYIAAGYPRAMPKIGSFEEWNIVREALVWLGKADPAMTRERLIESDPKKAEIATILMLWWRIFGAREVRLSEIAEIYHDEAPPLQRGVDKRPSELMSALIALTPRHLFNAKSIGHALSRHVDRIVGGLVLRARQDSSGKIYRVENLAEAESVDGPEPEQDEMPF